METMAGYSIEDFAAFSRCGGVSAGYTVTERGGFCVVAYGLGNCDLEGFI